MAKKDTRTIYIVRRIDVNGTGAPELYGHCEALRTANRIADGMVGADVIPWEAILHDGFWCAPFREIPATDEDKRLDAEADSYQAILNKALAAGLTMEEIAVLERHDNPVKVKAQKR